MGRNPFLTARVLSEDQKEAARERFRDAVRTLLSKGHVSTISNNQPILDAVSNLRRVAQDIGYEVEETN
jgi:hypothetical protein